jgi:hypothetical protein
MKRDAAIKMLEANEIFFSGMGPIMLFLYTARREKRQRFHGMTNFQMILSRGS